MKLIIGLGNPGPEYEKTRHNLGFRVIDLLREKKQFENWRIDSRFKAEISEGGAGSKKIILAKPLTFMNESGQAIKTLADYYKIPFQYILVIHDELDLPLGEIKVQQGRGSAGHKGVQSIIDCLGTNDFIRLRLGTKPLNEQKILAEDLVLKNFTAEEEKIIGPTIEKAAAQVAAAL